MWRSRAAARRLPILLVLLLVLVPALARAEIEITLKNSFIAKFKDRATIEATFTVDKAHKKPNAPSKDGDLHAAGRAPEIGLPAVAELMNGASDPDAVELIQQAERDGTAVTVTGAWRIWTEHGGDTAFVQGKALQPFDTTNPDHVFQIHPIITIRGRDVTRTLMPIAGYQPKDAHDAFVRYENMRSRIRVNKAVGTTTLTTTMAGFNYVEFIMEILDETQHEVADGRMVFATVRDLDGELLVHKRRMVFVKDTPPEQLIKTLPKGKRVHVLGMPRIDLALVSWRARNASARPEVLTWRLPYEIIVVGVYKVVEDEE
jgi:hypothetical protein